MNSSEGNGLVRSAVTVGSLALAAVLLSGSLAPAHAQPSPPATPTPTPTATTQPDGKGRATPDPDASMTEIPPGVVVRTVRYGRHARQRMDVWYREDGTAAPACSSSTAAGGTAATSAA